MDFYLGIDGGGTRTRAFAVEADGRRAGWGEAGPGNPNHATEEQLRANLSTAIQAALRATNGKLSDCVAVFAGLAGITTEPGREQARRIVGACGLKHCKI